MKSFLIKKGMIVCFVLIVLLSGCNSKEYSITTEAVATTDISINSEMNVEYNTVKDIKVTRVEKSVEPAVVPSDISPIDWNSEVSPTKEQLEATSHEYFITDESSVLYYLNEFGKWIQAEDVHVKKIEDELTGELLYYVPYYDKYEFSGDYEEEGYYGKRFSRLYDANGNLLRDWEEIDYETAVGDWIKKAKCKTDMYGYIEYENNILFNLKTNKKFKNAENIEGISKLDDDHVFVSEDEASQFYVLDKAGKTVFDSKELTIDLHDDVTSYVCGKYIVVSDKVDLLSNLYFYDAQGNQVGYLFGVVGDIDSSGISAPYILCSNKIYNLEAADGGELVPIYDDSKRVEYYDGEVAILDNCLYSIKDKEPLSDVYNRIYYIYADLDKQGTQAIYFYAENGNEVILLDRKGNIKNKVTVENLSQVNIDEMEISIDYNMGEDKKQYDLELNEIDPGKYDSIRPITYFDETKSHTSVLWEADYRLNDDYMRPRIDILDDNFNPIITGISEIYSINNGRFAIKRGLYIGIINEKGQWIVKKSESELYNYD